MLRGIYTGASGMIVQMHKMDAVANNMANVDLIGYKRDYTANKAFPELMMRRLNTDIVERFPVGSVDKAPYLGKLGTGVELNEVYTDFQQGSLRETENPFDVALSGTGFFCVQTPQGVWEKTVTSTSNSIISASMPTGRFITIPVMPTIPIGW